MNNIGFREKLKARQENGSYVCVGLDPLPDKIPDCIKVVYNSWYNVVAHMTKIVKETAKFACMFKPQKAHYEAIPEGQKALEMIVRYIHCEYPDIPVFLDCKRGDIDRTQQRYRIAHFDIDGVDGMNFSPYMGKDCMEQLVDEKHPERAIVGLCYTSNKSARETQDVKLADGRYYWEFMAETILKWATELDILENAGLVMAAAYEQPPKGSGNIFSWHLSRCREIVGDKLWFLVPGVGTQGGFIEETIRAGYVGEGSLVINSSSDIIFASSGKDFAEVAEKEAMELNLEIHDAVCNKYRQG